MDSKPKQTSFDALWKEMKKGSDPILRELVKRFEKKK